MQSRFSRLTNFFAASLLTLLFVLLSPLTSFAGTHGPDFAGNTPAQRPTSGRAQASGPVSFHVDDATSPFWNHAHYVYVNNDASLNSVSGFKLTQSGMAPLPGSPYATGGAGAGYGYGGNHLAISPDHTCLFASDDSSGGFNSFHINADGSLTLVKHVQVEAPYAEAIAASSKGGVVFLAIYDYSISYIDSFSVTAQCAIKEAQSTTINSEYGGMAVSPDGSLLFVSAFSGRSISSYTISGSSFKLAHTLTTRSPWPAGLVADGTQLYSGNAASNAQTGAYSFSQDGTLTELQGSPASDPQGANSAQVWFDHFDNQIISSEQSSNSFGLYAVTKGKYTFLKHSAGSGDTPTQMAQMGHLLLVTNENSGDLSVYSVYHGTLTFKTQVTLPVSGNPNGIAVF